MNLCLHRPKSCIFVYMNVTVPVCVCVSVSALFPAPQLPKMCSPKLSTLAKLQSVQMFLAHIYG